MLWLQGPGGLSGDGRADVPLMKRKGPTAQSTRQCYVTLFRECERQPRGVVTLAFVDVRKHLSRRT
jgi:hypothetical protein